MILERYLPCAGSSRLVNEFLFYTNAPLKLRTTQGAPADSELFTQICEPTWRGFWRLAFAIIFLRTIQGTSADNDTRHPLDSEHVDKYIASNYMAIYIFLFPKCKFEVDFIFEWFVQALDAQTRMLKGNLIFILKIKRWMSLGKRVESTLSLNLQL